MNMLKQAWNLVCDKARSAVDSCRDNVNKLALVVIGTVGLSAAAPQAHATAPTDLDGVSALGSGYITTATGVAVSAAILGFGWVGYRIVKKFTKGATST